MRTGKSGGEEAITPLPPSSTGPEILSLPPISTDGIHSWLGFLLLFFQGMICCYLGFLVGEGNYPLALLYPPFLKYSVYHRYCTVLMESTAAWVSCFSHAVLAGALWPLDPAAAGFLFCFLFGRVSTTAKW